MSEAEAVESFIVGIIYIGFMDKCMHFVMHAKLVNFPFDEWFYSRENPHFLCILYLFLLWYFSFGNVHSCLKDLQGTVTFRQALCLILVHRMAVCLTLTMEHLNPNSSISYSMLTLTLWALVFLFTKWEHCLPYK